MTFGFPVFDLSRILVIGVKFTIFVGFLTFFYSHVDTYSTALFDIVEYVKDLLGSITSIDLGCFMRGIGGVDFLNSLVNQFIFTSTFIVSAIGSILSYRAIVYFFSLMMKF